MNDDNDNSASMIFFPGDQEAFEDSATPEFRSHMLAAFAHKAGLGPDPGKYQGPGVRMCQGDEQAPADQFTDPEMEHLQRYGQALGGGVTPFDEEVERELGKLHPGEERAAEELE
jgi:hypothetical protein